MLITDYYKFKKGKGESRYDEVASTQCYAPLEALRNKRGQLFMDFLWLEDAVEGTLGSLHPLAFKSSVHITQLFGFTPGLNFPHDNYTYVGYGVLERSQDALLFIYNSIRNEIEFFIIRDYREHTGILYSLFKEGRLLMEIESIRKRGRAR